MSADLWQQAQSALEVRLARGRGRISLFCLLCSRLACRRRRSPHRAADGAGHPVGGLVRDGTIPDYAELARLGRLTRARMTQTMKLLNLAPDIQEQILLGSRTQPRTVKEWIRYMVVAVVALWLVVWMLGI